jgi:hypothetical protein
MIVYKFAQIKHTVSASAISFFSSFNSEQILACKKLEFNYTKSKAAWMYRKNKEITGKPITVTSKSWGTYYFQDLDVEKGAKLYPPVPSFWM